MRKRMLFLLMALIVSMSGFSVINSFAASSIENGLIFSLGIDKYDSVSPNTFTDLSGNGASFSFLTGAPTVGIINSMNGPKKYLKIVDINNPVHQGNGIGVVSRAIENQENLTIGMWAKLNFDWNNTYYPHLFYAYNMNGENRKDLFIADYNNPNLYYRPAKDMAGNTITKSNSNIYAYNNKWTYYTFTRAFNKEKNKWNFAVYANGVKLSGISQENISGTRLDEANMQLNIGTHFGGNYPINGYLGSFDIYNKVLSQETILQKYNKQRFDYVDAIDSMTLMSLSPSNDNKLNVSDGNIVITFDNYIDKNTVKGINFTYEKGEQVKGGIKVEVNTENEKQVFVSFGKLDSNTRYKLSLENIKSINGISLANKEFIYTTGSGDILNEDFSGNDYVVGSAPPVDKGISYTGTGVPGATNGITVSQTPDGDKYLSISSGTPNCVSSIYKIFDSKITEGYLIVETKIRPNCTSSTRTPSAVRTAGYFGGELSGDTPYDIAHISWERPYGTNSGTYFNWGDPFNETPKDENGFYNIRYILSKDENGYWYVQMYNLDDLSKTPIIKKYGNGPSNLGVFLPASIFPQSIDECSYDRIDISEFKIFKGIEPKAMNSNTEQFNPTDDKLKISFNDDMNIPSLSNITVTNVDTGQQEKISVNNYSENDREVELLLNSLLKYDTEYEISFDNVKSRSGLSVKSTENIRFKTKTKDDSGDDNKSIKDLKYLEITLNNKLIPNLVIPSNFNVYDFGSKENLKIKKIYYYPYENKLKIYVGGLCNRCDACRITTTKQLTDFYGRPYSLDDTGSINSEYYCKFNDISVENLTFYSSGEIINLNGYDNVTASVNIVNSTLQNITGIKVFFVRYQNGIVKEIEMVNADVFACDTNLVSKTFKNYTFGSNDKIKVIVLKNLNSLNPVNNSGGEIIAYD